MRELRELRELRIDEVDGGGTRAVEMQNVVGREGLYSAGHVGVSGEKLALGELDD